MSVCEPIIYHNVKLDAFECMKMKLEAAGFHIPPGNSGEMEGSGVKALFEWDGKTDLTITITSKPFIATCSYVKNRINDFVNECNGN